MQPSDENYYAKIKEDQETPDLSTTTTDTPNPIAQFDILDLILATTGFALAFAISNWQRSPGSPPLPMIYVIYGLVGGSGMAAFFLLIRRMINGTEEVLRQPGCMLILQLGFAGVFQIALHAIMKLFIDTRNMVIDSPFSFPEVLFIVGTSIISLAAAIICAIAWYFSSRRWRVFFFFFIGMSLLEASWYLLIWIENISMFSMISTFSAVLSLLAIVTCVVCLVLDRRQKRRYSWFHWIGVVLFLVSYCLIPIINMVLARFLSVQQMYGNVL